jgi:hypothetical protein
MNAGDFLPRTFVFVDPDGCRAESEYAAMAPGLQAQRREEFAAEWGVGASDTILPNVMTAAQAEAAGYRQLVTMKNAPADEAGAEAIHDVDANGLPIIYAYDDIARETNTELSLLFSHELCEEGADPECTRTQVLPDGREAAVEVCDQVEAIPYEKLGVPVSDFNTKSNFGIDGTAPPYDYCGKQDSAFQVLPGGYAQVLDPAAGWQQLTNAAMGMRAYRAELDRRGLSRAHKRRRKHAAKLAQQHAGLPEIVSRRTYRAYRDGDCNIAVTIFDNGVVHFAGERQNNTPSHFGLGFAVLAELADLARSSKR